jgi:hypothetical protein
MKSKQTLILKFMLVRCEIKSLKNVYVLFYLIKDQTTTVTNLNYIFNVLIKFSRHLGNVKGFHFDYLRNSTRHGGLS